MSADPEIARLRAALTQFEAYCTALARELRDVRAQVAELRAWSSKPIATLAAAAPAVAVATKRGRPARTGNPLGVTDAQMEIARRMRAAGEGRTAILLALNAVPGGRALLNVKAAENRCRVAGFKLGVPLPKTKQDTSAGQAACGNGPAPEGRTAGERPDLSARPPTVAKPAVAADPGSRSLPEPAHGEASWADCVAYCRHYDLPEFDGDMHRITLHLNKRGRKAWVLVEPYGPPRAAAAAGARA